MLKRWWADSTCPPVLWVLNRALVALFSAQAQAIITRRNERRERKEPCMYYGAIDLHKNNSILGIIDADGQRLCMRKIPNDLALIKKALGPFAENLEGIVVESTFNWYWLVDGLQDAGYRMHLANPTAIQQYSGIKYTDDATDAWWLAELLRTRQLKEGFVYPRAQRAVRDLLRKRAHLVKQRTQNILSIQNLTCRNTGGRLSANQTKQLTEEAVKTFYDQEEERALAINCSLRVIHTLKREITTIEKKVKSKLKLSQPYQVLQSVPGIGELLAMVIMLEAGDMSRFPSVGDFSSYCRCVSSVRLSNGKKKGSGNRKNGNKYLSWAFMEAAHYAIRYYPVIRKFYQRKSAKKGMMVAQMAVAHKLARASYYVLRDQVPFEETKCFVH
jgi:transposase